MKERTFFWLAFVLVVIVVGVLLLHKPETKMLSHQKSVAGAEQSSNSEVHLPASNYTANKPHAYVTASRSGSVPTDIEVKYRHGLISKGQAIADIYKSKLSQPQSFYGKVVDQHDHPIAGVKVSANMETLNTSGNGVQIQTYRTQSDLKGLFQFVGKIGGPINVTVKKEGYLMNERGRGYQGPSGEETTPNNRAVLTMWKLHGAEPLVDSSLDAKIPFDGTSTRFDIATGKQSANGDLQITLKRSPLDVRRGRDIFDWTVTIEILGGGILPENDPYPYWAPENGYQPSFEFNMSTNGIPWSSSFQGDFYIKDARGQYGRMQANVYAALTPARIQFNFTINPSGSQDLEPPIEK